MADDAIINAATPSPQVRQKGHLPSPAGRANFPQAFENASISPSPIPSSDDCSTTLIHNLTPETVLTIRDGSGKRSEVQQVEIRITNSADRLK